MRYDVSWGDGGVGLLGGGGLLLLYELFTLV